MRYMIVDNMNVIDEIFFFFFTHSKYYISHITHNNQTHLGMTEFVKHGAYIMTMDTVNTMNTFISYHLIWTILLQTPNQLQREILYYNHS